MIQWITFQIQKFGPGWTCHHTHHIKSWDFPACLFLCWCHSVQCHKCQKGPPPSLGLIGNPEMRVSVGIVAHTLASWKFYSVGEKGHIWLVRYKCTRHIQYVFFFFVCFFLTVLLCVRSSPLLQMQPECQSMICSCLRTCPWITDVRWLFVDLSESLLGRGPYPTDGLIQCKYCVPPQPPCCCQRQLFTGQTWPPATPLWALENTVNYISPMNEAIKDWFKSVTKSVFSFLFSNH